MRFHVGFSKRISKKTIIFLLGLISMALAMFFGNTEIVFAETTINAQPGYYAYYRDNSSSAIIPSVTCNANHCVYSVTNMGGFNGYNFTYSYDLGALSCSSRRADVIFNAYLRAPSGGALQSNMNISGVSNGTAQVLSMEYGGIQFKLRNVNLDQTITFITNASSFPDTQVGQAWILARITYDCITDSTAQLIDSFEQNTQDIIDNNNQNTQTIVDSFTENTQDIIDNQNDDNVSTATTTGSNLFGNFHIDDTRGLTSIITAPIRLLQGIINSNDSCEPYSFNIQILGTESQNVSLPSGCVLWNNVPSAVVVSYWVIVWAIVGYRILADLIHFTSSLRDPDHKNDYTLDL